jgi:hypothetical protein
LDRDSATIVWERRDLIPVVAVENSANDVGTLVDSERRQQVPNDGSQNFGIGLDVDNPSSTPDHVARIGPAGHDQLGVGAKRDCASNEDPT